MNTRTCSNCPALLLPKRNRHGLCEACYGRWDRAGRPRHVPQPRSQGKSVAQRAAAARNLALGREAHRAAAYGRLEDYVELTRERGLSRSEAALRVGVTPRTAERYEARLRAERTAA